jgi:ABC-type polysaccharide/polyol phosphate transport system ATPase subunit
MRKMAVIYDLDPLPDMVAVSIEGVSKIFRPRLRVSKHDRRQRLHTLLTLLGISFGGATRHEGNAGKVVLNQVDAQLRRGKVTGLIGDSGCGKSILLKIVAGVTPPTEGVIRIRGRLVRLLDMDDLNDNLTAIDVLAEDGLGSPKGRADANLVAMLAFAGLSDFADVPVRKYSTGMRQRLAMASVLCREAEVVLIDDYTAVGDLEFQGKCRDRMRALAAGGAAVVVASKDMGLLDGLCDEMVWLRDGKVAAAGNSSQMVVRMLADFRQRKFRTDVTDLAEPLEGPGLQLVAASVRNAETGTAGGFVRLTPLAFLLSLEVAQSADRLRISLTLFNGGKQVLRTVLREPVRCDAGERLDVTVTLPGSILAPGPHEVEVVVEPLRPGEPRFLKMRPLLRFQIDVDVTDPVPLPIFCRGGDQAVAAPDWEWSCTPVCLTQ